MPRNCSDGGVCESTRRFHTASPAFIRPAWRPTRGSGLGAAVDLLSFGAGLLEPAEEAEWAQAADSSPSASDSDRSGADGILILVSVTGIVSLEEGRRASSASERSRWIDPR